jgi:hypothetical protein
MASPTYARNVLRDWARRGTVRVTTLPLSLPAQDGKEEADSFAEKPLIASYVAAECARHFGEPYIIVLAAPGRLASMRSDMSDLGLLDDTDELSRRWEDAFMTVFPLLGKRSNAGQGSADAMGEKRGQERMALP